MHNKFISNAFVFVLIVYSLSRLTLDDSIINITIGAIMGHLLYKVYDHLKGNDAFNSWKVKHSFIFVLCVAVLSILIGLIISYLFICYIKYLKWI